MLSIPRTRTLGKSSTENVNDEGIRHLKSNSPNVFKFIVAELEQIN